jgi:hypothetical protein
MPLHQLPHHRQGGWHTLGFGDRGQPAVGGAAEGSGQTEGADPLAMRVGCS